MGVSTSWHASWEETVAHGPTLAATAEMNNRPRSWPYPVSRLFLGTGVACPGSHPVQSLS